MRLQVSAGQVRLRSDDWGVFGGGSQCRARRTIADWVFLTLNRAFEMGPRFDRNRFVDDIALNPGCCGQAHL